MPLIILGLLVIVGIVIYALIRYGQSDDTGRDPWLHCKEPNIGMEFAYLDLHKELGFFIEVYNEEKHGGLPADFRLPEEQ